MSNRVAPGLLATAMGLVVLAQPILAQKADDGLTTFDAAAFKLPAKWQQASQGRCLVLTPPDVPNGKQVSIMLMPTVVGEGDVRKGFTADWQRICADARVTKGGDIAEGKTDRKYPMLTVSAVLQGTGGPVSTFFAAVSTGQCTQRICLSAEDPALFNKYLPAIKALIGDLRLTDKPAEPPTAEDLKGYTRLGGLYFKPPANWKAQRDGENMRYSVAEPGVGAGILTVSGGGRMSGDLRDLMDKVRAAQMEGDWHIVWGGKVESSTVDEDVETTWMTAAVTKGEDTAGYFLFLARKGRWAYPITFYAKPWDVFEKNQATINALVSDLWMVNDGRTRKGDTVLVAGKNPLTAELSERLLDFFEWLLDVPVADDQRTQIEKLIVAGWKDGATPEELAQRKALAETVITVFRMQPAERDLARLAILPEFLKNAQAAEDDLSKLLVNIHQAGHKPLAKDAPPLTRRISDAFLQSICFMLNETSKDQPLWPDLKKKDAWAKEMTAVWANETPERRALCAQFEAFWPAMVVQSPKWSDKERADFRKQFEGVIKPIADGIAAGVAKQPDESANLSDRLCYVLARDKQEAADGQDKWLKLRDKANKSHANYEMMSRMMQMEHETRMHIIGNIGGQTRYEYRYVLH